jgi:predicted transcriptional regulator
MTKTDTDYPRITFRLNQELLEEISTLANKHEISNSKIIREALAAYLKKNK